MVVTNVISSSFQINAAGFYSKRDRKCKWVAPQSSTDSDIELDEETLEEAFDDDVLDPDFFLDNYDDDDLTPTASGKHKQCIKTNVLKGPVFCLGGHLKGQECLFWCNF